MVYLEIIQAACYALLWPLSISLLIPTLHPPKSILQISALVCFWVLCTPRALGEDTADCHRVAPLRLCGLTVLSLCSQDTFSITTKKASLDIFLPDGRSIQAEILTSDTVERVLEVNSTSPKIKLRKYSI